MTDTPTPTPGAPTTYNSWIPDVKSSTFFVSTFASGILLAGVSSWFHFDLAAWMQPTINASCDLLGIKPAPGAQFVLALIMGGAVTWFKKTPYRDIVKHITPALLFRASRDSNVIAVAPGPTPTSVQVVTPPPSA